MKTLLKGIFLPLGIFTGGCWALVAVGAFSGKFVIALCFFLLAGQQIAAVLDTGKTRRRMSSLFSQVRGKERINLTLHVQDQLPQPPEHIRLFDDITFQLNQILLDIVSASKKIDLFSADIYFSGDHLSGISDDQKKLMAKVQDQASEFQEELKRMEREVKSVVDGMEENSHRYRVLSQKTEEAHRELAPLATDVKDAGRLAAEGLSQMEEAQESTRYLVEEIASLNKGIQTMENRNTEISRVLSAIQDIAETTHLLGTNAAIEAARTGKAGRIPSGYHC